MLIATRREFVWSDKQSRYILLSEKWTDWFGPVALAKGASSQQTALADSQTAFYNQMTQDYSQQFASQNAILSTLQNTLNPIIAAGPNQFGYNQAETNTLNSQAIQGTGLQYANAQKALAENQAAQGGGNALLPSGVNAQQAQQVASAYAGQASNQLLGIQNAGYQQGYNTYESAISQLGGVASQYNPTGYSNSANSSGQAADTEANAVAQANNAASPWNLVGGILGGVASAATGGLLGGLGSLGGGGSTPINGAGNPSVITNPYAGLGSDPGLDSSVYAGLGG